MVNSIDRSDFDTLGRSFVLHVWLASADADRAMRRIALLDMESNRRRGFASLEEFVVFMEAIYTEMAAK